MQRLKGSGLLAREVASVTFSIVTLSSWAFISGGGGDAWLIAGIFQIVATVIALRSMFVGVYLSDAEVRLVSWVTSFKLEWSSLRRSDSVPYFGLLSKGIETRFAAMLRDTLTDGRMIVLPSTVGGSRTVARQAKALHQLIRDRS
jgi:hypothetical protein